MKIIVLWFFLLFFLHANETLTALFEQLENIKKEDKFKIVNEIKTHIIQLKEQERFEAIKALQAKKEAEVKKVKEVHDVRVESLEDNDVEVKMQEHMDSMENMEHMKDMKMPVNMVHMENMNSMMMMEEIKEREALGPMVDGASSVEEMREMMGNR